MALPPGRVLVCATMRRDTLSAAAARIVVLVRAHAEGSLILEHVDRCLAFGSAASCPRSCVTLGLSNPKGSQIVDFEIQS